MIVSPAVRLWYHLVKDHSSSKSISSNWYQKNYCSMLPYLSPRSVMALPVSNPKNWPHDPPLTKSRSTLQLFWVCIRFSWISWRFSKLQILTHIYHWTSLLKFRKDLVHFAEEKLNRANELFHQSFYNVSHKFKYASLVHVAFHIE